MKAPSRPPPEDKLKGLLMNIDLLLGQLGVRLDDIRGNDFHARSPIDGLPIAGLRADTAGDVARKIAAAHAAFLAWRRVPAPRRGELARVYAEVLRENKDQLGRLVSIETGKILQEGMGEVQEMIDICDFAVGLSRQLYGLTIASERPGHRMMETWHPIGVVGVVSAFNFPVAVWAWNSALAFVCGDAVVWKPSEKTTLSAYAAQALLLRAVERSGIEVPDGLSQVIVGGRSVAAALADHPQIALLSATGSTQMGRALAARVTQRLARTLLELGGNNAMIVGPSADLELAVRAIAFAAVGTAGQRCTSLRRLLVHENIYPALLARLHSIYRSIAVGNPLETGTLVGPLIDRGAFESMQRAPPQARADRRRVL